MIGLRIFVAALSLSAATALAVPSFDEEMHAAGAGDKVPAALVVAGTPAAVARVVTIPLDKQYVPVIRNSKIVSYKTAYFGKVFLGFPKQQAFAVVFDTGSGHFFVPSSRCVTESCLKHRRFDPNTSSTAVDLDHDGHAVVPGTTVRDQVNIAYGTGEVTGEFVRETACLSDHTDWAPTSVAASQACVRMRVITASQLTKEPFDTFRFDGVLGLGLDSLAVDPEFSFFGMMAKLNNFTEAMFGYFLSRVDSVASEISFGGHDERRMASDLEWVPVHNPELGYWQLEVKSISVAEEALPLCEEGGCIAIADTGTSLLGAPRQVTQRLHWLLARKVPDDPAEIDCRHFPGPDLVFELANGVKLTLGPEDYSRATAMRVVQNKTNSSQVICRASLLPVDGDEVLGPKAWILGEPALRKYYTAYDWQRQRIGFALAAQPSGEVATGSQAHTIYDAPPADLPTPTLVHV